jgi:hypothetical protein
MAGISSFKPTSIQLVRATFGAMSGTWPDLSGLKGRHVRIRKAVKKTPTYTLFRSPDAKLGVLNNADLQGQIGSHSDIVC